MRDIDDLKSEIRKLIDCVGRPVDAVVLPVLPHAAVIPGKSYYYSKLSPYGQLTAKNLGEYS